MSTTTFPFPVQMPWSRSRMMEPLSNYHYEIYRCKPVPINLNYASIMHQTIPQTVINLYHKQVHQPCTNLYQSTYTINKWIQPNTKYVPIMCHLLINCDSSICTNIINYTPHVCANSSTTCLNHVPNMYLNQNPSSISSSKYDLKLCNRLGVYDHIPANLP